MALLLSVRPASAFLGVPPSASVAGSRPVDSLGGCCSRKAVPLTVRHAVWSNPAVTQDYFDQISGRAPAEKKDQVGGGRAGGGTDGQGAEGGFFFMMMSGHDGSPTRRA